MLPFFFPNMLSAAFLTSSTIITNIDVVRDSVSIVAMDYRKRLLQTIRTEQRLKNGKFCTYLTNGEEQLCLGI